MEGNDPRSSLPLEGKASSIEFGRFVLNTLENFQGNEAMQHSLGVLKNKGQNVKVAVYHAAVE